MNERTLPHAQLIPIALPGVIGMRTLLTGLVTAVALVGTAQAALQDRDLNGDTVIDAFYDTDLKITWLRDANVTGPMPSPGPLATALAATQTGVCI